jgi:putative transposase
MPGKRRQFSAEFKAKVALAAVRGDRPISALASEFKLHPHQISEWKNQLIREAAGVFNGGKREVTQASIDATLATLYEQIGRLQMDLAFLKKTADR